MQVYVVIIEKVLTFTIPCTQNAYLRTFSALRKFSRLRREFENVEHRSVVERGRMEGVQIKALLNGSVL